ncbi:hypothetical protein FRC19_009076 [Serendipita sp. 401]|nr:hypothetical protein FRC19_009076 [Serendipita sp. 401]KAG9044492.1 hypothetical protein FS842_001473 [Serendipita sp. 407]
MSSVAPAPRTPDKPPAKRVRYSTGESSSHSSSVTARRRQAEEQATRELEEQRQASRQRVLAVWEGLEKRYSRSLEDDDIVDLESLTLIQDAGTLKRLNDIPFGSLATIEASEDEEEDGEGDELGDWDDTRFSAEATRRQSRMSFPTRRWTEEDERDLQAFMRAENERRNDTWVSDEDVAGGELETLEEYTEDGLTDHDSNTQMYNQKGKRNQIERDNDDGEDSTSSFRPSEERETNVASESGSDDELAIESEPWPHMPPPTIEDNSQGYPDSVDESSEDELAMSSPVRNSQLSDQYRHVTNVVNAQSPSKGNTKPLLPTNYRHRASGNPQLSTPPRSRSSGVSAPSEPYYSSKASKPVANSGTLLRRGTSLVASRSENVHSTPRPNTILGKRKRHTPPLPTPSRSILPFDRALSVDVSSSDQSYVFLSPNLRHRSTFEGEYSDEDNSPDPLEDGLSTYGSTTKFDYDSRDNTPAPTGSPTHHWPRSSSSYHGRNHSTIPETDEESRNAPDIDLLLFHMRGVNEWLKAHHPGALSAEDDIPATTRKAPLMTPTKPSPPRMRTGSITSSLTTPRNHHRIMSSYGGDSSARSIRSSSSAMGPPPTPLKLFQSSPQREHVTSFNVTNPYSSPSRTSHARYHSPQRTQASSLLRVRRDPEDDYSLTDTAHSSPSRHRTSSSNRHVHSEVPYHTRYRTSTPSSSRFMRRASAAPTGYSHRH